MAELNIGEHCSVHSCQQLDFLPFECKWCHQIYCLSHRSPDDHQCKEYDKVDLPTYDGVRSLPCSLTDCRNNELVPVVCEHCRKNFCLQHRHQVDHNCSEYKVDSGEPSKTAQHISKILEIQSAKAPKKPIGRKSKATAAKVALMKIKMKAVGEKSMPETERVYLQIMLPLQCTDRMKPMFFSKKWTIGRIIDGITKQLKLKNENNIAGAKKLRLFTDDGRTVIAADKTLEKCMEDMAEDVLNGCAVILEYVNEDSLALDDISGYTGKT
ncbi:AN1-type zinc finger protein 1-like [Lineus longissimus]|uniref:AN1-type zinc finger protein 1-like n=1 Tax=Lineus longissimus TaxID=88925 RepID=UPI00315D3BD0